MKPGRWVLGLGLQRFLAGLLVQYSLLHYTAQNAVQKEVN